MMSRKEKEISKTNAMRVLDARKIPYEVNTYSAEIHTAVEVAQLIGAPVAQTYKTLVVLPEGASETTGKRAILVMLPGDRELDLRRLASAIGEKKVRMATKKEAERLTGLQTGGISPLALLQKNFRVYLDAQALQWEEIYLSGGQRGINLKVKRTDLLAVTGGKLLESC